MAATAPSVVLHVLAREPRTMAMAHSREAAITAWAAASWTPPTAIGPPLPGDGPGEAAKPEGILPRGPRRPERPRPDGKVFIKSRP
ncbi:MAG: hypothetical protein LBP92_05740 [Deltaproteobacteria bacterium]|nr:hypothetical protein [Deltaproteobacteria bacterium]